MKAEEGISDADVFCSSEAHASSKYSLNLSPYSSHALQTVVVRNAVLSPLMSAQHVAGGALNLEEHLMLAQHVAGMNTRHYGDT